MLISSRSGVASGALPIRGSVLSRASLLLALLALLAIQFGTTRLFSRHGRGLQPSRRHVKHLSNSVPGEKGGCARASTHPRAATGGGCGGCVAGRCQPRTPASAHAGSWTGSTVCGPSAACPRPLRLAVRSRTWTQAPGTCRVSSFRQKRPGCPKHGRPTARGLASPPQGPRNEQQVGHMDSDHVGAQLGMTLVASHAH